MARPDEPAISARRIEKRCQFTGDMIAARAGPDAEASKGHDENECYRSARTAVSLEP